MDTLHQLVAQHQYFVRQKHFQDEYFDLSYLLGPISENHLHEVEQPTSVTLERFKNLLTRNGATVVTRKSIFSRPRYITLTLSPEQPTESRPKTLPYLTVLESLRTGTALPDPHILTEYSNKNNNSNNNNNNNNNSPPSKRARQSCDETEFSHKTNLDGFVFAVHPDSIVDNGNQELFNFEDIKPIIAQFGGELHTIRDDTSAPSSFPLSFILCTAHQVINMPKWLQDGILNHGATPISFRFIKHLKQCSADDLSPLETSYHKIQQHLFINQELATQIRQVLISIQNLPKNTTTDKYFEVCIAEAFEPSKAKAFLSLFGIPSTRKYIKNLILSSQQTVEYCNETVKVPARIPSFILYGLLDNEHDYSIVEWQSLLNILKEYWTNELKDADQIENDSSTFLKRNEISNDLISEKMDNRIHLEMIFKLYPTKDSAQSHLSYWIHWEHRKETRFIEFPWNNESANQIAQQSEESSVYSAVERNSWHLPLEIFGHILSFCDWQSVTTMRRICRYFNAKFHSNALWKDIVKRTMNETPYLPDIPVQDDEDLMEHFFGNDTHYFVLFRQRIYPLLRDEEAILCCAEEHLRPAVRQCIRSSIFIDVKLRTRSPSVTAQLNELSLFNYPGFVDRDGTVLNNLYPLAQVDLADIRHMFPTYSHRMHEKHGILTFSEDVPYTEFKKDQVPVPHSIPNYNSFVESDDDQIQDKQFNDDEPPMSLLNAIESITENYDSNDEDVPSIMGEDSSNQGPSDEWDEEFEMDELLTQVYQVGIPVFYEVLTRPTASAVHKITGTTPSSSRRGYHEWCILPHIRVPYHRMFGHDSPIQEPLIEYDQDVLLMQLDSDNRLDWCFGDVGCVYYTATQQQIDREAWNEVRADMQCG